MMLSVWQLILVGARRRQRSAASLAKLVVYSRRQFLGTPTASASSVVANDPLLVDAANAPPNWDPASAVVYPAVISETRAEQLAEILTAKFRRRRYERGHWDSVIQQYKEIELLDEDEDLKAILQPLRHLLEENHKSPSTTGSAEAAAAAAAATTTFGSCNNNNSSSSDTKSFTGSWLPCHAIDLQESSGALNAHVDSVRYSGNLVAGLSLMSSSVMRLKPVCSQQSESDDAEVTTTAEAQEEHGSLGQHLMIDLCLPPRSLYVLSGVSRYEYTHELLQQPSGHGLVREDCSFPVVLGERRGRRLSVIFRDAKVQGAASNN